MKTIETLLRDNIKKLVPYSSARDEFKGEGKVFLDANENSFGDPFIDSNTSYNRYPDPHQKKLKTKIAAIKNINTQNIFLGNGSDEAIDILFRAFCNPAIDNVIIVPPTYGMYEVSANINDVAIKKVLLNTEFQLDVPAILSSIDDRTKLIFLCSPNNPTGNSLNRKDIEQILNAFSGIVVLDEAYIDFSFQKSFSQDLFAYPNLVVLQTLSKAYGLAALRVGMAFASRDIINVFNKIKPPYNINAASQQIALDALNETELNKKRVMEIISQRNFLVAEVKRLAFVKKVFNSDANFILLRVDDANELYKYLSQNFIVVRNRSSVVLCVGCLRITVGTPEENILLINTLAKYKK
jgi:histidinol-phosphate aminotransferase